ncbi:sugar ABC transporter permease [Amnibacterium sp. CER49]|uniref:carbohydrate ABC transporter permease n=1 Tax=Amnibacterium sp. CER49 TaxID=3039161 RepID=UPI00244B6E44|nr:sugar ABC transporter permease [Amnibacterium sp. CER49]MDH2443332.1 sugar ABC transporter permease [Amnibacterium sp. CER49]
MIDTAGAEQVVRADARVAPGRRRRKGMYGRSARRSGVLFTLPALVLVVLFAVIPLLQAVYYSFTDWDGAVANWVGLNNYVSTALNPDLQRTLLNSLFILLSIPVGMVLPFATAYLLSSGIPGARLLRILIFAPTALSWVVIGLVARSFFATDGVVNRLLQLIGLGQLALNWLALPTPALVAVLITFNAAVFGVNTVIFLAGLATVDRSMVEAARVDGASAVRILMSVILPAMRRFVEFVFVITVVVSFTGLFALIFVMTGGGPGASTTTLEFAVWQTAFSSGDFGLGAALGLLLLLLTLGVIGLVRLFGRSGDEA